MIKKKKKHSAHVYIRHNALRGGIAKLRPPKFHYKKFHIKFITRFEGFNKKPFKVGSSKTFYYKKATKAEALGRAYEFLRKKYENRAGTIVDIGF